MDVGTRNSQAAYAKVRANEIIGLESLLRTTLRALAGCVARQSDRSTAGQLVARAHVLADRLMAALGESDEQGGDRQARAMAEHLVGRLAALERIADGQATLLS